MSALDVRNSCPYRHTGEGRYPGFWRSHDGDSWIPAFAGMTIGVMPPLRTIRLSRADMTGSEQRKGVRLQRFPTHFSQLDELFSDLLKRLCCATAEAVGRYVEVSGELPDWGMPEHFIVPMVFDRVGYGLSTARQTGFCMTLESSVSKVREWNRSAHTQTGTPDMLLAAEVRSSAVVSGGKKIDLVVFHGDGERLLALVEFKLKKMDELGDREKLLAILDEIDTCPFGVICGIVQGAHDTDMVLNEEKRAQEAGDRWHLCEACDLAHGYKERYTACARGFRRRSVP